MKLGNRKGGFTVYTSAQKRTVQHIIQTCFDLLHEIDFDQLTVQKICEESDINRSTFYRYFEDKYNLLYHVTQHIAELLYKEVQATRCDSIFEALIYYVDANKKLFKHLAISSRQVDIFNALNQIGSKLLKEQSSTNNDVLSIKIRHSKHPQLLCDFYSSGIIEVLKQWQKNNYTYTVDELVEMTKEGPDNIFL
ncbi:AcrR family transcriptional regulator [Staphylococcus hominis]|mgnify:CR=1 FL=1|nr:TetR/AcrR family transcriptional regulator [Staphylococcus hominis]